MAQEKFGTGGDRTDEQNHESNGPKVGDIDVASALVANVATPGDAPRPRRWALEHVAEEWGLDRTDLLRVNRMDMGTHGGAIVKIVMEPGDPLNASDGTAPEADNSSQ